MTRGISDRSNEKAGVMLEILEHCGWDGMLGTVGRTGEWVLSLFPPQFVHLQIPIQKPALPYHQSGRLKLTCASSVICEATSPFQPSSHAASSVLFYIHESTDTCDCLCQSEWQKRERLHRHPEPETMAIYILMDSLLNHCQESNWILLTTDQPFSLVSLNSLKVCLEE